MRTLIAITALTSMLVGCQPEARPPFDPTKPQRYRVLRGDTWRSIGSKRDCEPEDLSRWNGLTEDDRLIPGQVLWIYPGGVGAPETAEEGDGFEDGIADADPDAGRPDPAPRPDAPAPRPGPRKKVSSSGVGRGGTALLSMLDEVDPSPELRYVPSTQTQGDPMESILASRRANMGGGTVDDTTMKMERVGSPTGPGLAGPTSIPKLPQAQAKRCLPSRLDQDVGDYGMATAEGLDKSAIRAGMRPVQAAIQGCLPGGGGGPREVHLEVSLGCDGLVYQTETVLDGDLPDPVTACVEAVADQASFAAAAGATTFLYPIVIGY